MTLLGSFIVPHPPLIVPEVGKGKEREIQKTIDAYKKIALRISSLKPDTIILSTPHSIMYSDYLQISSGKNAKGDFSSFGVPEVKMSAEYDEEFVNKLTELAEENGISAGTLGEKKKVLDHGTMVPLFFINQYYKDYKLVRLSISGLSPLTHYRYGKCIAQVVNQSDKQYVYIASGDLSHRLKEDGPYGYSEYGVQFDREITEAFKKGDFLEFLKFSESFCDEAAECGLRSFIIMAGILDGKTVKSELLSYEGPFGVGYGVAAFTITGEDQERCFDNKMEEVLRKELNDIKENEDPYVKLARESLEYYLKKRRHLKRPAGLLPELVSNRAGVFVSLKKEGRLRGCIGTIMPTTDCIADEIIQNAVSAGTKDYRFEPVQPEELPWLVYDVDVLSESEPITSIHDLDVKRYGVIVSYQGRRGLLLPNLEGVDTPEQQVSIALKKGNISPEEPFEMERFEVMRHL
ncbi:AmmeMemoRadiSam system protein A [Anaerocolumna sedimenticola]|uniref:AmmeMemoRadiSam system protein A n=1 Tax=Anaerocolumna sedimenticola TaxID=2696063 RepID=A0A6P1TQC0_9FIRM|nr:AmmeMemoRadiSam system protein A [Anaerocolumna sedimenticola]QHQ62392.1 AmmeMemoRadiSam system protein A [Anaerocolumna sedimenticola]